MAKTSSDTRQQIMSRARSLLQNRGFDGFSYRDIASHLGIRNAAVHYHFPTKSDLGLALIEAQTDALRERIADARRREVPIPTQIEAYLSEVERDAGNARCLCAMGAMSVAWESMTEPMQAGLRCFEGVVMDWLCESLQQGQQQGLVHFEGAAIDKARQIIAAMQGARLLLRLEGPGAVSHVANQFRRELFGVDVLSKSH